jgi:hypothetical protein
VAGILTKAPGPNQISNSVYTHCTDILVPYLGKLYRATFCLKHYPKWWKLYSTIVLRKPGKPDYSLAKAYRPITLLDTMAKILSSCIAEDFEHMAKCYNMLPTNHFGCRPGWMATDSLHYLVKWIRDSLCKKLVVSVLFHNITGAFPNTVIPVLVHDLRCNGVPKEYTDWILRQMEGRKTILAFDDFRSEPFQIYNGLDQGFPSSGPFYQHYNGGLIDSWLLRKDKTASAFVDDAYFVARGPTVCRTYEMLTNMMTCRDGTLEWSTSHNSKFKLDKTGLMVFAARCIPDPNNTWRTVPLSKPNLTINGHQIMPATAHKFFGVILDQDLRFKAHADYAAAKGKFWVTQTHRISKTAKGICGFLARQLYNAVATTKMLYGASIWLTPI